jgi:4-amino-4-deoxy-L-arabinose transferase-like glycosyltransferase
VRALRDALRYRPFAVLLAAGVLVRIAVTALYFPAVMLSFDSARFARINDPLFGDYWMPAGYPIFLKLLYAVSDRLWFTIAVQHLIGLGVAILLFVTVVRLGTPRWLACVPGGVVLLSGDHVYLEHIMMADSAFIAAGTVALCAGARGIVPAYDRRWLAIAGLAAGCAMLIRSVGVVLVVSIPLCVTAWSGPDGRRRLAAAGTTLGAALAVIGVYVLAWAVTGGQYLGLSDMRGWNLYARVATFADCRRFEPPSGLRSLCDERPPAERPGPYWYTWETHAPARQLFKLGPRGGRRLERFARRAIAAQPLDYAAAVVIDLIRYVEPVAGIERGWNGQGRELVSFGYWEAKVERQVVDKLAQRYAGAEPRVYGRQALDAYQALMRVGGIALVLLLGLGAAGVVLGRGPLRFGATLFGLASLGLYTLPALTLSYDFRYGIPPETFLVVAGTLGAAVLARQRSARLPGAR